MAGSLSGLVSSADVDAYLRRLEVDAEPPSVAALVRLHRAQVEKVPYETIWIHLGQQWGIDPVDSLRRVARDRRGGYCYHLNGAFFELLGALGYRVSRHIGGVHGPEGPSPEALTNHLVLVVEGLPADSNPGGRWYVDAGLGDALYEPLPMVAGECHAYLSTSPQSGFVRVLTAQRRHATGMDILRGLVLTRTDGGQRVERELDERRDWLDAIADLFGLRLDADPPVLESL